MNSKQLFLLFFTASFLTAVQTVAQKTTVYGKVTDSETSQAIPYSTIGFPGTTIFALSDEKGNYRLETENPGDSLMIQSFGYISQTVKIKKGIQQKFDFQLSPEIHTKQVITVYKDEPAVRLIKKVIRNKENNHIKNLDAFQYEVYEKIKVGDKDHEQLKKQFYIPKPFRFFLNNIDTTPETTYLPLFITETVKNVYYLKRPESEKEEITSVKMSGLRNESLYRLFTDRTLEVDVYENYYTILNKNFISPVSDNALNHYVFSIEDSVWEEGHHCFHISFKPRHKQELTFTGDLIITDSSYAIKSISATMASDANINFVTDLSIFQTFTQAENGLWLPQREDYIIHGEIEVPVFKNRHFYGRKTSTYKNFIINQPKEAGFYSLANYYEFLAGSNKKGEREWNRLRHYRQTVNDSMLYKNTDSLKNHPVFRAALVFFTGYKTVKGWQIGPWFRLYSYNPVEGHRFQIGLRSTPAFRENLLVESYLAFGTNDLRLKYRAGFQYFFQKMPRHQIGFYGKDDIEQLTWSQNIYRNQEALLSTLFKISASNILIRNREFKAFYVKEWKEGLQHRIQYRHNTIFPLQDLVFLKPGEQQVTKVNNITTSEISLLTHWGIKEKYLVGDYKRTSLGSAYPIFDLVFIKGISGFLGGAHDYTRTIFSIRHRLKTGSAGYSRYRIEAGKIWGKVPYPLLELHNGNQSFFYDELSFNTMNFLEFASDQYASIAYSHFFDGFIFNKIPLVRKLKLREVVSGKVLWGSLRNDHQQVLIFPEKLQSLGKEPFAEAGFGIDNIFKVIRIDFLWRLNYLDKPDIDRFRIMGSLHVSF